MIDVCGGPRMDVLVGRVDAAHADPENMIPAETLSSKELSATFARMGLSLRDMIALSGSHTLGAKGFGDPLTFDNQYYKTLLEKPWESQDAMKQMIGIASDHVLPDDPTCRPIIQEFAANGDAFYEAFSQGYAKLTQLGYAS